LSTVDTEAQAETPCSPLRLDDPDCDYYRHFAWFRALPFLILLIVGQAVVWILVFAVTKFYFSNPVSSYTFLTQIFQKQGADGFLPWIMVGFPFYALFFTLCALSIDSRGFHIIAFCFCLLCVALWPLDTLCYLRLHPHSEDSNSLPCAPKWWFNYTFILGAVLFYAFCALSSHVIKSEKGTYWQALKQTITG
jgi:hypothetical protein